MKRLIQITIVALSIFLFLFIREAYIEHDEAEMYTNHGHPGKDTTTIWFYGNMSDFDEREFIGSIYDYCQTEPISFWYNTLDYDRKEWTSYLAGPYSLKDFFGLYGDTEDVWSDPGKELVVTNQMSDSKHYYCFNRRWNVKYISMNQFTLDAAPLGSYIVLTVFSDDKALEYRIADEIVQKYKKFGPVIEYPVNGEDDYRSAVKNSIRTILIFLTGILTVLMFFFLSDQLKPMTVFKLNGYNGASVLFGLIGKELLTALALSFLLSAVLYAALVSFIAPNAYVFIGDVLIGLGCIAAAVLLMVFVFSLIIRTFSLSSMLKGKNISGTLAFGSYLLKVGIAAITIPVLLSHVTELKDVMQVYRSYSNAMPTLAKTYRIVGYKTRYKQYQKYYDEYSDQTEDPDYLQEIAMKNEFVAAGACYSQIDYVSVLPDSFDLVEGNMNYLEFMYPNSSEKDEIRELVKQGNVVLVLSNKYKDFAEKIKENLGLTEKPDVVLVSSLELKLISFKSGMHAYDAEGVLVLPNDYPLMNNTIFYDYYLYGFTEEKINGILRKFGKEDMMAVVNLNDPFILQDQRGMIAGEVGWILAYGLLLVLEAYSFFITYRNANRKKTAVQTLHGYRFFQLYWDYLLEAFLIYVPVVIFYKQPVWEVIVIAVIVEIVCMIPAFIKAKKTGLVSLLKAEEEFA